VAAGAKASAQVGIEIGTGDQGAVRRTRWRVARISREQVSWTENEDEYDSDSEEANGEEATKYARVSFMIKNESG